MNPAQPVAVNTLAYVDSACREDAQQATARQALKIRQRSGETVTVTEFPMIGPVPALGLCPAFGQGKDGTGSVVALPLQRLGVSPDGATVVFEVNDDFSILSSFIADVVPPEQEGIFAVHADGSGLHRLGPPSREASFRFVLPPASPTIMTGGIAPYLGFSPDGNHVTFTDLGPGPDGQEATQVMTLDLATGTRKQVTNLPLLTPISPLQPTVFPPAYIDGNRILFLTKSVEGGDAFVIVRADGSGEISRVEAPVSTGGGFIPRFTITAQASAALAVSLLDVAVNPIPGFFSNVTEIFVVAGDNRLQVTHFGRSDTGVAGALISRDATRVLFTATADPFQTNPDENCQFFSIDTLGADLRQVTAFTNGERNASWCTFPGAGCGVNVTGQDLGADAVVFESTCNPFSRASNSGDEFAMRFDGSGLVQLTSTPGMTTEPDGTVDVELPGPLAYPEVFR